MQTNEWFMTEVGNLQQAINAEYFPDLLGMIQQHEINGQVVGHVQMAYSEAPEPFTPDVLLERAVYTNRSLVEQALENTAEMGYLTAVSPHTYTLTERGEALAKEIMAAVNKTAVALNPLPADKAERLFSYLDRIRQAMIENDQLEKPCLQRSLFFDQGDTSPLAEKIRRRLNDFTAFRDDVHTASWAQHGVSGAAWDGFSHIWGETVYGDPVNTAAGLAEKMSFHGFTADEYAKHLQTIVDKGWLTESDGEYSVTEAGNKARWEAEKQTDVYFYSGWDLSDSELDDLKTLMAAWVEASTPPANNDLYQRLQETRQAISTLYIEPYQAQVQEAGLAGFGLFVLMHAGAIAPEAASGKTVQRIVPYMTAEAFDEHLEKTAASKNLIKTAEGYSITDKGKAAIADVMQLVETALDREIEFPAAQLSKIAAHLRKMSSAFEQAGEPEDKPVLAYATHFNAAADAPLLHQISRAIAEIIAFRDDAHVAAFQKYDVPAYQWEAFSHVWGENVWGDKVETGTAVYEKLAFRGHSQEAYINALNDCATRGWLKKEGDSYTITEEGQKIRTEAEQETDRLFYTPWQRFAPRHIKRLYNGLDALKATLTPSE